MHEFDFREYTLRRRCRFHLLKPEYVHHRIKQLQRIYRLRIILCHVDVDDVVEPLSQVRLVRPATSVSNVLCDSTAWPLPGMLQLQHRRLLTLARLPRYR